MNANYCTQCGNGLAAYQNGFCVVCERNRYKVATPVEQSSIDGIAEYVKVISGNFAKLVDIFSAVNSTTPYLGSATDDDLIRELRSRSCLIG